ncbi:TonB-dependent receptor domain-containing protein [Telmatospirillum sp. J64-1]|uniref:TonB-dependent receptor domain-containing protein n=1 Tax=Telmatospirillum sp. J64-1 TaxID=2502183 RepID=UPI00115DB9ED|nr:TonB-dependent receptor [Telmatospirillum sp. J64-1]
MNARRDVAATCLVALTALGGTAWAEEPVPERHASPTSPITLPSIVVTATASERDAAAAPASISVIDGESLRRQPVNDLADAVRGSVGISLENTGLGRRGISIRGMSSEHTLILVDGQRITSSASSIAHSDFEQGWVPTEAIERVEVVRGPMSSLYGSEALGGVVNIITRSSTDRWHGSVSSYALLNEHDLDGNQYKGGFYLGGPLVPGRLGLNVWGEYRHRDALRDAGNTALTAIDEQRVKTGHLGLTWTPDDYQRIDLSVTAGEEDQEGFRGGTSGPIYKAENDVQRRRYSVSHAGEWGWGDTQVRLYQTTLERKVSRSDGADLSGPNRFTDTVLDGRVGFAAGNSHKLTLGAETRRESLEDPNVNRSGKKEQTHYALFAQDEIVLGEKWELVLGSRFDHHEDFGWETSPRAYLLFHPTDELTFKAGMGRGFKAPTLKQLSPEFESRAAMGGRGIIRGNPDLQPETNQSFELGVAYARGPWSGGATFFHNDVRNLIETVRQPTCFEPGRVCLEYENVAKARLQGLELTAGLDLTEQWRLDANYTYLEARNQTTDERLPDRSRHSANATLAWAPLEQLTTRMRVEYSGSQYRSATERERPDYTLLHWYGDYALNRSFSLHFGIENLTDERLANDDASVYGRADEGRRYFAGLTGRF